MSGSMQKTRQFISPNPLPPPMHSAWTRPTWTICYAVKPQSRRHAMTATCRQFSDKLRPSPRCSSLSARSGESQRTRRIVSGCNQDWGHEGRNVAESDLSCRRVCSRDLDGGAAGCRQLHKVAPQPCDAPLQSRGPTVTISWKEN